MSPFVSKLVFAFALVAAHCGLSAPLRANESAPFIRVGLPSLMPFGWADFCQRYPRECEGGPLAAVEIDASRANMALIDRVNRFVNLKIQPKTDMEQWQVVDRWDLPVNAGDCEDFVLLKRKLLIEAGLPRQALLVTIVRDERKDGHAVLTVKTNRGEFILDNMSEQVKRWTDTPYAFIKRQSQEDQNVWVAIGTQAPTQVVSR